MVESDIELSVVTASDCVSAACDLCYYYTRVRYFRWTYNVHGDRNATIDTEAKISALSTKYYQNFGTVQFDVTKGDEIKEPYFQALIDRWSSLASNEVGYTYSVHEQHHSHGRSRR